MAIEQQLSRKTTGGCSYGQDAADLISFHGVTPIAKGAHIVDATDAATAITGLNSLLAALEAKGLLATS
jgi:hypothetical protein